jgi:uncharacterized protein (TIGR00255 family)
MTGFGDAERQSGASVLRAEIRTVNHRHLHVNFRTPASLVRWEAPMRDWLRASLSRGAVHCMVQLHAPDASPSGYALDTERVEARIRALREIAERWGVPGTVDLALVAEGRDLLVQGDPREALPEVPEHDLRAVIEEAARRAAGMREDEGLRLHADLDARLHAIARALEAVRSRAPERLVAERDRLRNAVAELADGVAVSPERLAQEVAVLAERLDVNEELVRFGSHLELFRELMDADAAEPVGKRLAFLVQEMHREANTVAAKANDARIAHEVVGIKDEIEKLREQVENVE